MIRALITGGAGFIGSHLARYLKEKGYFVRCVDWKPPEFGAVDADECDWSCDMRFLVNAIRAMKGIDEVYALAANMGGMSFVSFFHYDILHDNHLINLATAEAAVVTGVKQLFYASSACVYPTNMQLSTVAPNLKEDDAWTGHPDNAYGVEKLASEELYLRMSDEFGIDVRIARYHNIYGPEGAWAGNRPKAPAWLCRLAGEKKLGMDTVFELHGNGEQTRSYCYIDDCLELSYRLMRSMCKKPLNIGTDRSISVNDLARMACGFAGVEFEPVYDAESGAIGVQGRNADLAFMKEVLGYEPQVPLEEGMKRTYEWVFQKVKENLGVLA